MSFWKARMGPTGCRTAGWMRMWFALLCLIDRILLLPDLDFFFHPEHGMLEISDRRKGPLGLYSLLRFAKDGDFIWVLWTAGFVNAFLLFLGVAPRLNLVLLHLNSSSFHNANELLCDGTASGNCPLQRIFNVFFVFMPLHYNTIYDGFGGFLWNKNKRPKVVHGVDSWPMWPVWLFQWQSVMVYAGAGGAKYKGSNWMNGTAMYYILFGCPDECNGLANPPDFIVDHMIVLKLISWTAMVIETVAPFAIWFTSCRKIVLIPVTLLHIGMDLTMNMNTLQPMVLMGWYCFLIQPDPKVTAKTPLWRQLVDMCIYFAFLAPMLSMTFPWRQASKLLQAFIKWNDQLIRRYFEPFCDLFGTSQSVWALFTGNFMGDSAAILVFAVFRNGTVVNDYWTTPDWINMPRWERKRRYNFLHYYKHLADCGGCEEQRRLLIQLADNAGNTDVAALALHWQEVWPPPPPEDAGWWEPVRQPLEVKLGNYQLGVIVCHGDENNCGHHKVIRKLNRFVDYVDELEESQDDDGKNDDSENKEDQGPTTAMNMEAESAAAVSDEL